jgi:hypothetical protein
LSLRGSGTAGALPGAGAAGAGAASGATPAAGAAETAETIPGAGAADAVDREASSVSVWAFLNSRTPDPRSRITFGNRPAPNTIRMITRTIISSGPPRLNGIAVASDGISSILREL